MRKLLIILLALPAVSFAGHEHGPGCGHDPKPKPKPPAQHHVQGQLQGQAQGQNQTANGVGVGVGIGGNSDADANSNAAAFGGNAVGVGGDSSAVGIGGEGGNAQQSQTNQGNNVSAGYEFDSKSLALSLPGANPDYGSTAPCLESTRGFSIAVVGWSGRTKINGECFATIKAREDYERCVMLADAYVRLNRTDLALAQLTECGGQEVTIKTTEYVTRDELIQRDERIIESVLAK